MEHIFLVIGVVIIIISLILTYKAEQKDDEVNYLEAEILSELRGLKNKIKKLSANPKDQEFKGLVKQETELRSLNSNLEQVDKRITNLEEKINSLNDTIRQNNQSSTPQKRVVENELYQEIKSFKTEGLEMTEIAKKLDLGMREIELIWKLNSRREG